MNTEHLLIFTIVAFALAIVVILKKDSIPSGIRRPLAVFSLLMVVSSFVMLVVAFFQLGS